MWPSFRLQLQRPTTARSVEKKCSGGSGSRNNGGYFLIGDDSLSQTVFNDNDEDKLTGSSGLDWYFANLTADNGDPLDIVTDRALSEFSTDTDF